LRQELPVSTTLVPDELFSTSGLRGETRAEATALCDRVGLGDQLDRPPDELPHAGLLRLELGRALATDPDLLLVGEPFAGLARGETSRISDLLEEFRRDSVTA